jgi:quercetin dioxygenase-like cupin family protein
MPGLARAAPAAPPDETRQAAQAIEKALQKHAADVHRCFAKSLADRLDVAGKVEVEVDVGKAGKVTEARIVGRAPAASPELSACVQKAATSWTVEGIEPGAKVILPFAFQAQVNQFAIKAADVPERVPGGTTSGKAAAGPTRAPPFTTKVLADETNVRATHVSLTQLSVGPASRVAMHRHPHSGQLLFLVKGHARLLGPSGVKPIKLDEGMAVFVPAGYPHVIENMGRQSTAVFLQAFAPPGPERVYRDPTDARGRAEFEVIRDPRGLKVPPESEGRLVLATPADAAVVSILGGKGTARTLVDAAATGSRAMSVQLLELEDGAEMPRASRDATELLYVIQGAGKLTVGREVVPFGPEELLFIPAGQPRSVRFTTPERVERVRVLQIIAPAGAMTPPAKQATGSGPAMTPPAKQATGSERKP